jgi:hypothetical protein
VTAQDGSAREVDAIIFATGFRATDVPIADRVRGTNGRTLAEAWGGDMRALPRQIPRFTHELRQLWEAAGSPVLPAAGPDAHDAIADARHNLARWTAIVDGAVVSRT